MKFFLSTISLVLAANPSPVWPTAFSINFNETVNNGMGNQSAVFGTWYYSPPLARMDRFEGSEYDRFCRNSLPTPPSSPTTCQHLNVAGYRYLVFPEIEECCMCCTDAFGCGVTNNSWVLNGAYKGRTTIDTVNYHGQADYWEIIGLQTNYYYQTTTSPAGLVALIQGTDDYQWFDPTTMIIGAQDPSLFTLPSYCDPNNLCNGFCKIGMRQDE